MSTRFTALEIGSGDAFLLEEFDNEWKCLYDAGGNQKTIVSLLTKKHITKINLAICSHSDKDHANGFIGLLQSNINIDEIWLPGTWASVLKYVKDKGIGPDEVEFLGKVKCECKEKATDGLIVRINDKDIYNEEDLFDPEETIKKFSDSLSFLGQSFFQYSDFYCLLYKGISTKCRSLVLAIDRIITIARLAYQKGCKIRWFKPVNYCTRNSVDYGFVALNSEEMSCVQKPKNAQRFALLLLCYLTAKNKYSLVFEYLKDNIPITRFSADSDCSCQSVSPYSQNIIVTAPHHGSSANANVYSSIQGKDIIWVRSDKRKSKNRPCSAFKNLNNKYCLACFYNNFKTEISFEYSGRKQWSYRKGNPCIC